METYKGSSVSWPRRGICSKQQEIQLGARSQQLEAWDFALLQSSAARLQANPSPEALSPYCLILSHSSFGIVINSERLFHSKKLSFLRLLRAKNTFTFSVPL